jgi:ribosomal protein L37AE/L43A
MSFGSIIEGLEHSRTLVSEEVTNQVKQGVKTFYSKAKAPADIQKKINNILNAIYIACNSVCDNSFIGGKYSYHYGSVEDLGGPESGMMPLDIDPGVHTTAIYIRLEDRKKESACLKAIESELKKIASNYSDIDFGGGISIYVSPQTKDYLSAYGFCVMIPPFSDVSGTIEVDVEKYTDPLNNEGALGDEIGLPIDKENCEGTDVSSVATPEGKIGEKKIICPKCKSDDVNIREDDVFHCTACGYEWDLQGNALNVDEKKSRKKIAVKEGVEYDFSNDADKKKACDEYSKCTQNSLSSSAERRLDELDKLAAKSGLKFNMTNYSAYMQPHALVKPTFELVKK